MTIAEAIAFGANALAKAELDQPTREANSLLQFAVARDRAFIIGHPEYELSSAEETLFRSVIDRRSTREPFQHIVGRQEFFGLDFLVTPDVLIPRPETELIVERAIDLLNDQMSPRFLEIGVGSGCISIAILKHCPKASAFAVDISESAIAVAKRNAAMHGVADRLQILVSNIFERVLEKKFDLIVSNPPYVPLEEYLELQPEVRNYDPRIAVTDGSTGLTIIERIVVDAPDFLRSGGRLLMEIGFGQDEQVQAFFKAERWKYVGTIPDLQGIPRTVDAEAE